MKKHFNVDENRILVRGFSMGGASAWHIGAHYGTDFAAVAPGAGFSETKDFFGYTRRNVKLTWFEEKLLHLTNATDYAVNFFNVPVVAYNGDKDGQKQAADIMATNMEAEGMTLSRIIGKDIGHAYTPESIVQINEKMDALAQRGRQLFPREVRFTTWTLKFNRMRWVVVDGVEKHWDRARVTAVVESDHAVKATTMGVTALSFDMGAGSPLLNPANTVTVTLDGQALTVPGAQSDGSWTAHFTKSNGKWVIGSGDPASLSKRHDMQGPIDDAFMDAFLNIRPTGTPMNEMAGKWAASEMDHAAKLWRSQMRGDAPAKDDTAVTDADIANSNLVLWGDPQSNKVLARILAKLPIQWTADSITLGTRKFPSATHAPIMIYPNPLNPKKYVVINSGITFREYAEPNNSLRCIPARLRGGGSDNAPGLALAREDRRGRVLRGEMGVTGGGWPVGGACLRRGRHESALDCHAVRPVKQFFRSNSAAKPPNLARTTAPITPRGCCHASRILCVTGTLAVGESRRPALSI